MTVTSALHGASRAIGSLISGEPSEPEILDTLKKEHDEVGEMLKQLVDSEKAGERKNLVAKIKAALLPHVQAEQKVLYDALIATKDKQNRQDGQEGYIEHEIASATLSKLEKITDSGSTEFAACAKVLKELIEHHVQEEERNVWADARKQFSADQLKAMNNKYLAAKKSVVTPKKAVRAAPAKAPVKPAAKAPVKMAVKPVRTAKPSARPAP